MTEKMLGNGASFAENEFKIELRNNKVDRARMQHRQSRR